LASSQKGVRAKKFSDRGPIDILSCTYREKGEPDEEMKERRRWGSGCQGKEKGKGTGQNTIVWEKVKGTKRDRSTPEE